MKALKYMKTTVVPSSGADLRSGSVELIKTLKKQGHKVYLVADGLERSFYQCHTAHCIYEDFDGHIFSENVGAYKPDRSMFDTALRVAGLGIEDCRRVMMVGNNLARDIAGANQMNMISVHMRWSPRYEKKAMKPDEVADYAVNEPLELLPLIRAIEEDL